MHSIVTTVLHHKPPLHTTQVWIVAFEQSRLYLFITHLPVAVKLILQQFVEVEHLCQRLHHALARAKLTVILQRRIKILSQILKPRCCVFNKILCANTQLPLAHLYINTLQILAHTSRDEILRLVLITEFF